MLVNSCQKFTNSNVSVAEDLEHVSVRMSSKWVHLISKQVCHSLLKRAIVSCGRVGSARTNWFERKFLKPMCEILVKHYPLQ